jgi:pyruvate,water dikinase
MNSLKFIKPNEDVNFIFSNKWIKIWDFYFPLRFLNLLVDIHLEYPRMLGYENRNTLHIFSRGSEEAYFIENEIKDLEKIRKKKLMSEGYMRKHLKEAEGSITLLSEFLDTSSLNSIKDLEKYSCLFKEMLSYYRASRPEIFEIVELLLKTEMNKKYYQNLIEEYGKLRFKLKKAWFDAEKRTEKLRRTAAKKLGLTFKEYELMVGDKIVNKTELRNRNKLCVFGLVEGKKVLFVGDSAKKITSYLKEKINVEKIIKGRTVFHGFVIGKVRIIPQSNYTKMMEKARLFQAGEILVTGMTQPDIVFACNKASAIITDEGGITCHAAIISRELKIPCVIGTKIATKIFKDGDLVEVDAERGIVRLLKR